MGQNLGPLNIKDTYQDLVQTSGSVFTDGEGNLIASVNITASEATNATTATSASHALVADNGGVTSIVAGTNITIDPVGGTGDVTISAVGGAGADTGSLLVTASISDADITFTKGDASTFDITVNNVANATTATTASYILGSNVDGTVATATSASHAIIADSALSATSATTASYVLGSNVDGAVANATNATNATTATTANTASYIQGANVDGTVATATTASHALVADTLLGSVQNAVTASYILGSGVDGTVATATSASHAVQADSATTATDATNADNIALTSNADNTNKFITFTASATGDGTLNTDNGIAYNPFINKLTTTGDLAIDGIANVSASIAAAATPKDENPFDGDRVISGSLNISSSITANNVISNQTDTYSSTEKIHEIVSLTQTEYDVLTPQVNTLYVINDATGSLVVSASYAISSSQADTATSASYVLGSNVDGTVANATSASYATTASLLDGTPQTEDLIFSGSVRGEVKPLYIISNTASLDCSDGNFFTLQLVGSVDTHINPSNISPGQTINVELSTTGSGTVSFPSSVKQVSGSAYVPTTEVSKDIVTFISFDSSTLYLSNVKNLV